MHLHCSQLIGKISRIKSLNLCIKCFPNLYHKLFVFSICRFFFICIAAELNTLLQSVKIIKSQVKHKVGFDTIICSVSWKTQRITAYIYINRYHNALQIRLKLKCFFQSNIFSNWKICITYLMIYFFHDKKIME